MAAVPVKPLGIQTEVLQTVLVRPPVVAAERAELAQRFYQSFDNLMARNFYAKYLDLNFAEAVIKNHPDASKLNKRVILEKCSVLVKMIVQRVLDARFRPETFFDVMASLGRASEPLDPLWFPEIRAAYREYSDKGNPAKKDRLLFPYIKGNSLVDIGCGSGRDVAWMKARHPEVIKKAGGIDVVRWAAELLREDFQLLDLSKPGVVSPKQYDTGMLIYVIHHVGNTQEKINIFLTGVKTAVRSRLLVMEDIVLAERDLALPLQGRIEAGGQPEFREFLMLNHQARHDFTVLNDFFLNGLYRGVSEISFPLGFHSITEWVGIFKGNGFKVNQIKLLGFPEGNFHRACHCLFVLDIPEKYFFLSRFQTAPLKSGKIESSEKVF